MRRWRRVPPLYSQKSLKIWKGVITCISILVRDELKYLEDKNELACIQIPRPVPLLTQGNRRKSNWDKKKERLKIYTEGIGIKNYLYIRRHSYRGNTRSRLITKSDINWNSLNYVIYTPNIHRIMIYQFKSYLLLWKTI